ncbi:MAG: hypothetical protein LLG06_03760, partial [Desulfobacteraceae bacterium]|nr:hypothetical protein [Desulfobacteraceae bacterium]
MLNKLYQLSEVLKESRITAYEWHKYLRHLPNASEKKPCFRICLGDDSPITAIEPINVGLVACLRKLERNNGYSFPGLNVPPLYRISDEDSKKTLGKWLAGKEKIDLDSVREWCKAPHARNWDEKLEGRMKGCLVAIPTELRKHCTNISSEFEAVNKLCERTVQIGSQGFNKLFEVLEAFIWQSLERGEQGRSLLPFLIHGGSPGKAPESDRGSISVFFDVSDWKEFPVAHERTMEGMNECLLKQGGAGEEEDATVQKDAFGGGVGGQEEKLPDVKLPVIGGVKLRAMNHESPCQYRYGTIDAKSFRIGSASRTRAKGALEWLQDESREGKTWGRADGKELLFAYPATKPEANVKLASCFGAGKQDDTEALFEEYSEDVVECLKGISRSLKDIELRVFALRKMDGNDTRTKVVFHRNYSAQRLADGANDWRHGCANIPPIRFRVWGETKGEIVSVEPAVPFPLQIADCLNRVWNLDGTTRVEVKSIQRSTGIELLLDESASRIHALHLLAVALQNGRGFFLSLGNALHANEVIDLKEFKGHKQLMPSILGLLLW